MSLLRQKMGVYNVPPSWCQDVKIVVAQCLSSLRGALLQARL